MKLRNRILLPGLAALLVLSLIGCSVPARISTVARPASLSTSPADLLTRALSETDQQQAGHYLAEFVAAWFSQKDRASSGEIGAGSQSFKVTFQSAHPSSPLPGYFDEIIPAHQVQVKKMDRFTEPGVGGPVLAIRENRQEEPIEAYFPPEAITRPLTAIATELPKSGERREVVIELHCPLYRNQITIEGKTEALAADYSVSWAALLSRARDLSSTALGDLVRDNPKRDPQLYLMQPYDPKKEPLIMIHGLIDTPLTWADLSNELWADEAIRSRYQIWHYLYNTSAPALYPGRLLRKQLRELRPLLDPQLDDTAMQSTTLLTHSMGGIVGRSLIVEPGDVFWDAAFTRPISELKLSTADRASLREAFFWQPERYVKRVIFVGVPHRGSNYARNFVGQIGRAIAKPPSEFREFYERISSSNPGAFTELYQDLGSGRLDSVAALSPEQPTLKILAELEPPYPVKLHSIIGNRGRNGPLEESSDGVVPYWSSHLDFADSEKVVPSGHEVFSHPEGKQEIFRILKSGQAK